MMIKFYGMIYALMLLLAIIFTYISPSSTLIGNLITFIVAIVVGTFVAFLAWLVDRGDPSIIILKGDTISFKGTKTPNDDFKLSEFDKLSYHKGFWGSYLKLERAEGEPPNWYKAFGCPKEEDKDKLEKLIRIANRRMKK